MTTIIVEPIAPDAPDVAPLLDASEALMRKLYPAVSTHIETIDGLKRANVLFVAGTINGAVAGCGALKRMEDDGLYGEIKRLFVDPSFRGRGIARAIMAQLEAHAVEAGLPRIRLETGIHQPESIALYRSPGYGKRGRFGAYPADRFSVFMEKDLSGNWGG